MFEDLLMRVEAAKGTATQPVGCLVPVIVLVILAAVLL